MNTQFQETLPMDQAPVVAQLPANLIEYVTSRLAENQHPSPAAWQDGLHSDAYTTVDFSVHRFLVNRQLRMLIGAVPENTTQVRYCLVDGGTPEDWMRLFEEKVLACMVKFNIPQNNYPNA